MCPHGTDASRPPLRPSSWQMEAEHRCRGGKENQSVASPLKVFVHSTKDMGLHPAVRETGLWFWKNHSCSHVEPEFEAILPTMVPLSSNDRSASESSRGPWETQIAGYQSKHTESEASKVGSTESAFLQKCADDYEAFWTSRPRGRVLIWVKKKSELRKRKRKRFGVFF